MTTVTKRPRYPFTFENKIRGLKSERIRSKLSYEAHKANKPEGLVMRDYTYSEKRMAQR